MAEFASKNVAGAGLGLGIAGTALGLANGGLANFFNGMGNNGWSSRNNGYPFCFEQTGATHYDLEREARISEQDSELALLKSEKVTNNKIIDVYERLGGRISALEKDTAVNQQRINDNLTFLNNKIDTNYNKMKCYVDGHFVPGKLIMPLDSVCPPAAPLCPPATF